MEPEVSERDPAEDAPRRIALVITRSDAFGGAQLHVMEIADGLRLAGHHVEVFVGGDGNFHEMLRARGVKSHPIQWLRRDVHPVADSLAPAELLLALRRFKPDLVSCHTSKAGVYGRLASRVLGIPNIMTAHGWPLPPGELGTAQRMIRLAERTMGRLTDHMIAVSHYDRRLALKHRVIAPERMTVIHNGISDIAPSLRASTGDDTPRMVMVARFQEPKDPRTLLHALAPLAERSWQLDLIGDGPLRPEVESLIHELGLQQRVTLLGERFDVAERLAQADIFILATKREGFPISVLEAMRASLPVVASDVGGICEAITSGETGVLAPPEDPEALRKAIEPLLTDSALRRQLGEAGRVRYEREFTLERHVRRIWSTYHAVMAA